MPAAARNVSRSRRGLVVSPTSNSCGGRARRSWGVARGRAGRWPRSRRFPAGAEGSLCGAPARSRRPVKAGLAGETRPFRGDEDEHRAPEEARRTSGSSISLSVAARPRTSDYATRSGRSLPLKIAVGSVESCSPLSAPTRQVSCMYQARAVVGDHVGMHRAPCSRAARSRCPRRFADARSSSCRSSGR